MSAGPLSRRPEKRHTRVGAPGSTAASSGAAVNSNSTSGTNPTPDVVCSENAARALADGPLHATVPASVDRLKRRSSSRRCMGNPLEDVRASRASRRPAAFARRASRATDVSSGAPCSTTVLSSASGSVSRTPVRPSASHSTVTLHGSSSPTDGSAEIALNASGGLHAPRIMYGRNSRPSFSRNAARRSISVRTPNPSCLSASRTRVTAASKAERQFDVESKLLRHIDCSSNDPL